VPSSRTSCNTDLSDLNTSHSLAVLSVRAGSRVLGIGAAEGSVAKLLVDRGCRVWAVEADERAAREAALVCERVITGDVERLDLSGTLGGARFDVVLFLDVLEHLRDPQDVLKRSTEWLAPGGQIIASIPNVAHGAVRLSLLRGTFAYTERGLLARTHLRFFDRQAVEALFRDAGLDIRDRLRVTRGLTETEIPIDLSAFPPNVVSDIERDPESTTFQFVIVATAREGLAPPGDPGDNIGKDGHASLAERLLRVVRELEERLREADANARVAESQQASRQRERTEASDRIERLTAQVEELAAALTGRMAEAHSREAELRHLRADLAVKEAFATELRQALNDREDVIGDMNDALRRQEAVAAASEAAASRLQAVQRQYEHVSAELASARTVLAAPSVRAVTRVSARLRGLPLLRGVLRRLFGGMFLRS
jgi:2-polyprenyl-3-methyl-5-hydroxy-6-metoxy-1,4-benzoquinol methylase